ncbi:hypothetical protein [Microbacterium sp. CGR1]|uniref:hypothetical protein n=1 Tax=Microbacterium sp. CGR1 TaxID=1696072 RepID=UPI003DA56734
MTTPTRTPDEERVMRAYKAGQHLTAEESNTRTRIRRREQRAWRATRDPQHIARECHRAHPDGTKPCPGCGRTLPLEHFAAAPHELDGLHFRCTTCHPPRGADH